MAIISTPTSGRVQFKHMGSAPDTRLSGVNPLSTASQIMLLAEGLQHLQSTILREAFHIMETELEYIEQRHGTVAGLYEMMATYAPSWGMMGTMVGLILMLLQLENPDAMGPMLSVALVTTFYGCIMANFLCNPIASKLKQISNEEILLKIVLINGMLSIQAGDNPRIIEEKLKSFLAPALRNSVGTRAAAGGGEGDE